MDTGSHTNDTPVPEHARPVHPDGVVDDAVDQASPEEGMGSSPGTEGAPVQHRQSPVEGLGATEAGEGSPVRDAESPAEGLGGTGSPVQDAESPAEGLGSSGGGRPRAEHE
jgi:hypothetical protein